MAIPTIIDTDMAMDDWMAIVYLLLSPAVDVRAITVVATGEAHAGPGTSTARRLLALTNTPNVAVVNGRSTPLRGNNRFSMLARLAMDARLGLRLPASRQPRDRRPAAEVLIEQLLAATEPVMIVALGPMTNLAEAIQRQPEIVGRIKLICGMGGALEVPGNIREILPRSANVHAEWNMYIDPYAAGVVLQSGVPYTLVPLDATNQLPLTAAFIDRLSAAATTPGATFVLRLLRRIKRLIGSKTFYFWDPLAAVVATHPEVASFEQRRLRIVEEDGAECGRLMADVSGSPIQVCTRVDQARFEAIVLHTLAGIPSETAAVS